MSDASRFNVDPLDAELAQKATELADLLIRMRMAGRTVPFTVSKGADDMLKWSAASLKPRGARNDTGARPYDTPMDFDDPGPDFGIGIGLTGA